MVFFTKGYPTENVWIYDARTNVPGITKKDRPLTPEHFAEFEKCFGADPNGRAKRKESDSPAARATWAATAGAVSRSRRWRPATSSSTASSGSRTTRLEDADDLPPPEELATDAIGELEGAVEELNAVLALLENGNGAEGTAKRPDMKRDMDLVRKILMACADHDMALPQGTWKLRAIPRRNRPPRVPDDAGRFGEGC